MPWYRATATGYLPGNRRVERGQVFEFDGKQGSWMEPCDPPAYRPVAAPQQFQPLVAAARPAAEFFAAPKAPDIFHPEPEPQEPPVEPTRAAPKRRKLDDAEADG